MKNHPNAQGTSDAKKCQQGIMPIMMALQIFMALILIICAILLFVDYKKIKEKQSHLNDKVIPEQQSQQDNKVNELTSQLEKLKQGSKVSGLILQLEQLQDELHGLSEFISQVEKNGFQAKSFFSNDIQRNVEVVRLLEKMIGRNATNITVSFTKPPLCEEGWLNYRRNCYYTSRAKKTWMSSKTDCENKKAHLVVINNKQEMNYLLGIVQKETWWIGLTDADGSWKWVDGTSYALTPTFWMPNEPNNYKGHTYGGSEDCAEIVNGIGWNDDHCSNECLYICEKEKRS